MAGEKEELIQEELKTPRAAAIAGILFALLFSTSWVLVRQFFSTLFFGSGYLYLGMTFASAAMAAGALILYAADPSPLAGLDHLSPGGGAHDQHRFHAVGGPGLSGLGFGH
jgi:hypothetical protein